MSKESWKAAVEKDGAIWNHLILSRENDAQVSKDYSITGIPVIILIDPDGKI